MHTVITRTQSPPTREDRGEEQTGHKKKHADHKRAVAGAVGLPPALLPPALLPSAAGLSALGALRLLNSGRSAPSLNCGLALSTCPFPPLSAHVQSAVAVSAVQRPRGVALRGSLITSPPKTNQPTHPPTEQASWKTARWSCASRPRIPTNLFEAKYNSDVYFLRATQEQRYGAQPARRAVPPAAHVG